MFDKQYRFFTKRILNILTYSKGKKCALTLIDNSNPLGCPPSLATARILTEPLPHQRQAMRISQTQEKYPQNISQFFDARCPAHTQSIKESHLKIFPQLVTPSPLNCRRQIIQVDFSGFSPLQLISFIYIQNEFNFRQRRSWLWSLGSGVSTTRSSTLGSSSSSSSSSSLLRSAASFGQKHGGAPGEENGLPNSEQTNSTKGFKITRNSPEFRNVVPQPDNGSWPKKTRLARK